MASETWSAILSGWPSVTDAEVNRKRSLNVKLSSHCREFNLGGLERGPVHAGSPARGAGVAQPHRTHSRTGDASTVRLAPWDAWFHGNCRERLGAIACSERAAKADRKSTRLN